jgi:DNA-binding transcriptional ArsR family regulator
MSRSRLGPDGGPESSLLDVLVVMKCAACQPGLTLHETRLLVVIASYADHRTMIAFPSTRTLADWTGIDRRNLSRSLRSLIAKGFIEVVEEGGKRRSSRYRLDAEKLQSGVSAYASEASPHTPQRRTEIRQGGVSTYARGGVSTHARVASPDTPELPINGQVNGPCNGPVNSGRLRTASRSPYGAARPPRAGHEEGKKRNGWHAEIMAEGNADA